ncbi:hypothetical protein K3495_g11486 [Podosphaera aphanis]|nr:hypothetical protein K3495_g11486 [Podosphaera aphanis]
MSKKISAYECFSPTDDWTKRPRVLTYLRKGVGLAAHQLYPLKPAHHAARDLLFLKITAPSGKKLTIVNVYNTPTGSNDEGEGVRALLSLSLGTETAISQGLDVTSDHFPIFTIIPWDSRFQELVVRLKPETIDEKLFLALLSPGIRDITDPAQLRTAETLDNFAQRIYDTIKQAYSGSARRAMGKGTGQPWWNTECKAAAQTYRRTRRSSDNQDAITAAKKVLRTVTRRAKQKFFQDKLNQASTATDVYGMVNWHRLADSFRTPPLKDPLYPDAPLAVTAESKRQVLAQNLL